MPAVSIERDSSGRQVIQFKATMLMFIVGALAAPPILIGAAYQWLGKRVFDIPVWFLAGPFVAGGVACAFALWMSARSKVRITVDPKAGKLIVQSASGSSELLLGNVSKAEFASSGGGVDGTPAYRLEFVLHSGERVPATSTYSSGSSAREREVAANAVNEALSAKQ